MYALEYRKLLLFFVVVFPFLFLESVRVLDVKLDLDDDGLLDRMRSLLLSRDLEKGTDLDLNMCLTALTVCSPPHKWQQNKVRGFDDLRDFEGDEDDDDDDAEERLRLDHFDFLLALS